MADKKSIQSSRGGVSDDFTIGGALVVSQGSAAVFQLRARQYFWWGLLSHNKLEVGDFVSTNQFGSRTPGRLHSGN